MKSRVKNDDALGAARRAAREEGLLVIIPSFGEHYLITPLFAGPVG